MWCFSSRAARVKDAWAYDERGTGREGSVAQGLITNLKRASAVPDLPTATEAGYPSLALDA
jgi:hypothetical protein